MSSSNFTPKSTLPVKPSAKKIFKSFSPQNWAFIHSIVKGILAPTDFSLDGKINYKLLSPSGQPLINERALLDKLNVEGLFSYYGEDGIFGIVTLGNINVKVLRKLEIYLSNAIEQSKTQSVRKRSDLKQRYNQVLDEIKKNNQSPDLDKRYKKLLSDIKDEEINPFVINQNLADSKTTDFTDTTSRKGYEKKWDVLQAIWDVYESHSRPDSILVPVARLTIKGRDVQLIDGIVEGLKKEGLFQKWDRKDRWYNLEFINHEMLPKVYREMGDTYKKFTVAYQQRKGSSLEQDGSQFSVDYPSEFLITVKDREIWINNLAGTLKINQLV